MSVLDSSRFSVLTFDCYGTLVDWEAGIVDALRPILDRHGVVLSAGDLCTRYGAVEAEVQGESYRPYAEVLAEVVRRFGVQLGFTPSSREAAVLAESLPNWPVFPDTVPALCRLRERYRLGIVSNIDDLLIAQTVRHLGIPVDWIITAEQARSYRPRHGHFTAVPEACGGPPERILHCAASLFHDIVPCTELGWSSVWVNRRTTHVGVNRALRARARPTAEVPDLAALADVMCCQPHA